MKAPLIGISRHRLTTDGQGVTTLVAFHGCPLRCQYCLNSHCLRPDGVWQWLSVDEILEQKRVRHIDSFIREHPEAMKITSGANKLLYYGK